MDMKEKKSELGSRLTLMTCVCFTDWYWLTWVVWEVGSAGSKICLVRREIKSIQDKRPGSYFYWY